MLLNKHIAMNIVIITGKPLVHTEKFLCSKPHKGNGVRT